MKILNEFLIVAAAAIFGYIMYKAWQAFSATAGAANAFANTASQYTPGNLASTLAGDVSSGLGAVGNFIDPTTWGDDSTTQTQEEAAITNQIPGNDDYNQFIADTGNPYAGGMQAAQDLGYVSSVNDD